jgi:putative SOS response-associated peptidase YedK
MVGNRTLIPRAPSGAALARCNTLPTCNLYSITRTHEAVPRLFKVADNRASRFDPLPAVFPGNPAPTVRRAADGERELVMASWVRVME